MKKQIRSVNKHLFSRVAFYVENHLWAHALLIFGILIAPIFIIPILMDINEELFSFIFIFIWCPFWLLLYLLGSFLLAYEEGFKKGFNNHEPRIVMIRNTWPSHIVHSCKTFIVLSFVLFFFPWFILYRLGKRKGKIDWITEGVFNNFPKSQQTHIGFLSRSQKQALKAFLKSLTRTERTTVVLYYYDKMTIPEISKSLDLSASEVSQIHSSIIARLKAKMKKIRSNFESTESSFQTGNPYSNVKMFELFTDLAQEVTMLATQEARRLNHEYIGTEHLLLALVQKAGAVCRKIFNDFNITETNIRQETEKLVKSGTDLPIVDEGKLPYTPRAKNVIKYAVDESQKLQSNYYVGTENILLGLLRETDGIAYKVLTNLGLELNEVRKKVSQLLGGSQE